MRSIHPMYVCVLSVNATNIFTDVTNEFVACLGYTSEIATDRKMGVLNTTVHAVHAPYFKHFDCHLIYPSQ